MAVRASRERVATSECRRASLGRFLDGFGGNRTARTWAVLGKCSSASAQRDLLDLVGKRLLKRNPGGSKFTSQAVI